MPRRINSSFSASIAGLWLLFFVLASSASPLTAKPHEAGWARPVDLPYAENFFQVSPDLYRAAQPSAQAFKEYEKLGIKTVINLREKHSDINLIQGTSLKLIEVPLKTWDIDDEDVIKVLRLIKNEPKPILLHCMHGADRTGLMSAMYRVVFEGWTREQALRELREGDFGHHDIWINISNYMKKVDAAKIRAAVLGEAESREAADGGR